MNPHDEIKVVNESLDAFKALRDGLGHLRSISACFEMNEEARARLSTLMVDRATSPDSAFDALAAAKWSRAYFQMIPALLYSLLFAALQHYTDLTESNSELKHEELEAILGKMRACGLLDTLSRVRNAVFHVKPNENIEALVDEAKRLFSENQIAVRRVEDLLYECTAQIFLGTKIYRQPREKLEEAFQEALAYYHKHVAGK